MLPHIPAFNTPRDVHRYCLCHLSSNVRTHFQNIRLKKLTYQVGRASNTHEFNIKMQIIKRKIREYYDYLQHIDRLL